ncbi:sodium solute symporter [Aureococcus anophagefferens]|nr:sodium solute symporter [Aureococcus anophagefferens]
MEYLKGHAVKEVVVRVTRSNQRSGRHWEPFHGDASFATVQPHELALILTHLRNLAVAYDNMTADEKRELTTVRELVVNLDWLCALAKHCVASDERRYADAAAPRPRARARVDRAGDGAAPPAPFAAAQPAGVARGQRAAAAAASAGPRRAR